MPRRARPAASPARKRAREEVIDLTSDDDAPVDLCGVWSECFAPAPPGCADDLLERLLDCGPDCEFERAAEELECLFARSAAPPALLSPDFAVRVGGAAGLQDCFDVCGVVLRRRPGSRAFLYLRDLLATRAAQLGWNAHVNDFCNE